MFTISIASLFTIIGIVLACVAYAIRISYRLGSLEERLKAAEVDILKMEGAHATKEDFINLKESIEDIKKNIGKLFDLVRERSNIRP